MRTNFQQALNWYSLLIIIRFIQRELRDLETDFISKIQTLAYVLTTKKALFHRYTTYGSYTSSYGL